MNRNSKEFMSEIGTSMAAHRQKQIDQAAARPQVMVKNPKTGKLMTREAYQESLKPIAVK